jgi:hypothetical protein
MKNHKSTIIVTILIIFIITITGCNVGRASNINNIHVFEGSANTGTYKSQPTEVDIDIDLPAFPDRLMAYRITNQEVTEQYTDELAAKLGFFEKWPLYGGERLAYSYTKNGMSLEKYLNSLVWKRSPARY